MKLKVVLKALDNKIPIGNRFMICSLIKKCIQSGDKDLFNEIYLYEDKKNKKIKDFTFSIYLNNFNTREDYVEVLGDIVITISTPDYNLGIAIYNGLIKNKFFDYKEFNLKIEKTSLLKERKVNSNKVILKTLSPIYIRDLDGKGIDILDERYNEKINYISNLYLESFRGRGLSRALNFIPHNMKRIVVKEEITDFKALTGKSYIYFDAYKGVFELEGDMEDIQLLMEAGIGFRRSEGFGLVDLA